MGKPFLPNVVPYIQAGINPKTGLPEKWNPACGSSLASDVAKELTIVDRQDAINRYVWFNLPSGLDGNLIERILYYKGQGALFFMESDEKFYFLPYALDGTIDVYGRYTGITPVPLASNKDSEGKELPWISGLTRKPQYDILLPEELDEDVFLNSAVLLHDYSQGISQTIEPRFTIQKPIIDLMADCLPFLRTALQNSTGIDGIKVQSEDEQSNVKAASLAVQRAALNSEKWIPIIGEIEFQQLTSGPVIRAEEFLQAMQAIDNYRLSLYGMDNGGLFQKASGMLEGEQRMNTLNSGIILQDGLEQRLKFADIANSIWGTSIYCEINETLTNTDNNLDGRIGGDQDYNGEPEEEAGESEANDAGV